MHTKNPFNFEYSYLSLPGKFYSLVKPDTLAVPEIFLLNEKLCDKLNISKKQLEGYIPAMGNENPNEKTFAQAYAGHQFGHFTKLGDGRAIILGEHIDYKKQRFDVQLKGSGITIYSRRGDGKATLKSMLREYLISEAMYHLNIPTSRSLAVIKTGQPVFRETMNEGAALIRVMKSHIRVGTFEYAAHFGSTEDLKALANYTINRLYPDISQGENPVMSLLKIVMEHQIELVVNWLRVGFIHGVMNTDNTAISGETFDYGPCAFLNSYNPDTVFSSIDRTGRYAFGNQPGIIKWNIARFAEAMLSIIHSDKKVAIDLAQELINSFDDIWKEKFYNSMLRKIGIENANPELFPLADELLVLMQRLKLDYTNTFAGLSDENGAHDEKSNHPDFKVWKEKWEQAINSQYGFGRAKEIMRQNNPIYIPRNHLVEQALDEAVSGNRTPFERLLNILSDPYSYQNVSEEYMQPPGLEFENRYQTFCGT